VQRAGHRSGGPAGLDLTATYGVAVIVENMLAETRAVSTSDRLLAAAANLLQTGVDAVSTRAVAAAGTQPPILAHPPQSRGPFSTDGSVIRMACSKRSLATS
jgi:hypothetical protein